VLPEAGQTGITFLDMAAEWQCIKAEEGGGHEAPLGAKYSCDAIGSTAWIDHHKPTGEGIHLQGSCQAQHLTWGGWVTDGVSEGAGISIAESGDEGGADVGI
jgi:hypothetical protein